MELLVDLAHCCEFSGTSAKLLANREHCCVTLQSTGWAQKWAQIAGCLWPQGNLPRHVLRAARPWYSCSVQQELPGIGPAESESKIGSFNFDYPDAELVFGLVYAVGTDYFPVQSFLEDQIRLSDYRPYSIHLSDRFGELARRLNLGIEVIDEPYFDRVDSRMRAGNRIREAADRPDVLALEAASQIYSTRETEEGREPQPNRRTAYVVVSLKRPEEVDALRKIYGPGFYLIGIFSGEAERVDFLTRRKGLTLEEAKALIERDQKEAKERFGQRLRDTFQMADVFVATKGHEYESGLRRFLPLVFGYPFTTPTRDEHGMFLAYAASLRSGDLSRQVGAAISCAHGDVISLGCNDVPAPGGGLYWEDGDPEDQRDHVRGSDSNDTQKALIIDDVLRRLREKFLPQADEARFLEEARPLLKQSLLADITEFGRSVHAEMEALIAAGRTGVTFRESTLYTTTFPCHTCTRHIIAAGIRRVVYIEPYPKSLAPQLHSDAITLIGEEPQEEDPSDQRIPFEPFLGIGPRRFFDLFSMRLSSGYGIERKAGGERVQWDARIDSRPRVPLQPTSYLEREQLISNTLYSVLRTDNARIQAPSATTTPSEGGGGVLENVGDDGSPSRKIPRVEDRKTREPKEGSPGSAG
jgi:deoxycytidylate deaminase